jgi:hypothetical protein
MSPFFTLTPVPTAEDTAPPDRPSVPIGPYNHTSQLSPLFTHTLVHKKGPQMSLLFTLTPVPTGEDTAPPNRLEIPIGPNDHTSQLSPLFTRTPLSKQCPLSLSDNYIPVPPNVPKCPQMSPNVPKCPQMSPNVPFLYPYPCANS